MVRDLLASELGLTAFVETTGGHGLRVHVPLDGRADFDEARAFAREAAGVLETRHPGTLTTSQRISGRGGRIYLDVMRNAYAQTVVAQYGVRGRPGAFVATPVSWDEVADEGLTPGRFTLRDGPARLAQIGMSGDPWAGFWRHKHSVAAAQRKLSGLI